MNPWLILAAVIALIGSFMAGEYRGTHIERTAWEARIEKERADAAEAARKVEHDQQEKVNATLRKQNETLAGVNAGLRRDLDGLRNRPERPADLPATPRPSCEGATGAELSRTDAEFLVRQAARADEQRAGLVACYEFIDALK